MGLFDKIKQKFTSAIESAGFDKITSGLEKTRSAFVNRLKKLLGADRKIDNQLLSELEELLITSDIGAPTTNYIIGKVKETVKEKRYDNAGQIYDFIKQQIVEILQKSVNPNLPHNYEPINTEKPYCILVVGVNGVGKTTTIGKLANNYKRAGNKVIIGAADTFRAAANEQLEEWVNRAGVEIVQQRQGADPAAVAFDAMSAAKSRGADVVIIDTAGRLHNKANLMAELEKIHRVLKKSMPNAPHEVLLALDATTGQNALQQAKEFSKAAPLTGLILTKLDGTAKGGVTIAVANEMQLPVRYIGVGEKIDDLQMFDPIAYAEALFNTEGDQTQE